MSYTLKLSNYKSTRDRSLIINNGLTILSSPNAGGKSSVVEAFGLCLGLEKKALGVESLKQVINDRANFCSVSLDVRVPGVAIQKMAVEIRRELEEDDEGGEENEEEEDDTDDDEKFVSRFLNGTKTSEEDFLAAARPLGTNVLGTVLGVVNHDVINRSPSNDRELTKYLRTMSGARAHSRTPAYKRAKKAVRASEIHSEKLKRMEDALKKVPRNENTLEKELSHIRMRKAIEEKKDAAEVIIREGEERREAAFRRFVAEVSARMDGFVRLFWNDQRNIRTWMEVKASGKVELKCQEGGEHAFKADLVAVSGGERRIIQLALSFSILAQFNVPLAIVDNADKSFFKENGTRILKFCDLVLENSQTMKAIVLVGNDQHNFFRYAQSEGYNILRI
ncbi:unnamed protein product [Caenorhabditis brenneri]